MCCSFESCGLGISNFDLSVSYGGGQNLLGKKVPTPPRTFVERVYRKFRVILGAKNLLGDSLSAQASRHEKKTSFLFRLGLVRPFSSRAREENQNDLARSLFPKTL
jgi:hypothetical protein